jgi:alanyl aminopeptidase
MTALGPAAAPTALATAAPGPGGAAASEPVPLGRLPSDVRLIRESLALAIDPAANRFGGTAVLALHLAHPRRQIWLHGRDLAVTAATVVRAAGPPIAARWEQVDPTGVVRVTLAEPVRGDVALRVAFDAAYDGSLVGVYRVETSAGPAVYSKFEAIYARRAFPSFDEPAFKAPYEVELTVPESQSVIGNMPIAEQAAAGPGKKRVRFQATPALPSYLVAFAVGPFESRARTLPASAVRPQPLPIGAVALRGRGDATAYALADAPALVAEQERYFGLAFPYPKLDLVAVPDFQSGAMENAGAIAFRDSELLVDDQVTSLDQRIAVTSVIAHETAHQWFGDLVTMPWWNDIWLNEGFATFLASRTLRAVHPEFEAELKAAASANGVMAADSLASARRIRQPIESTHDITNAFDGITYQKGAAVLAMLEHYLGDEPFRRGLHEFLAAHAGGNATTDDLIAALTAASGKDIRRMAASFLEQPGVPAIAAALRCEAGRGRVELSQSRWRPVGSSAAAEGSWTVPVCVRAGFGKRSETACTVLDQPTGSIELPGCADWILGNADAAGYYRSALAPADLARLGDRGMAQLSVVERLGFGYDLIAAFRSAALPGGEVMRALEPLARDHHGSVAVVPLALVGFANRYVTQGAARQALRRYFARLYAPAVAQLGWQPTPTEPAWRRVYRIALFSFLADELDDPAVLSEAARRGRSWLGLGPDHRRHTDAVAPDLADLAVAAAAQTGGADVLDALVAELAHTEDAQIRQRLLGAIASVRQPALINRALDVALDPKLRKNEHLIPLRLLGAIETRDAAWDWLVRHFDALTPLLPDRFAGRLPALFDACDAVRTEKLRAFFAPRVDQFTGGPRTLAQSLEIAEQCAAQAAAQRDSVLRYVAGLARR